MGLETFKIGGGIEMNITKHKNFIYNTRRPFFDLGDIDIDTAINSYGPLIAYNALENEDDYHVGIERIPNIFFRNSIITESRLKEFNVTHPQDLVKEYRTNRWEMLCSLLDEFDSLTNIKKLKTVRLLINLGFYNLILKIIPKDLPINEEINAKLIADRAFTDYFLHMTQKNYSPSEFYRIIETCPKDSEARHFSAKLMLIHAAKFKKDLNSALNFRSMAEHYLTIIKNPSTFHDFITYSRFYRSASFTPLLQKDYQKVTAEMDLAEEFALNAPVSSNIEKVVLKDLLVSTYESRMREALILNDLELGETYIQKAIAIDPWDSKLLIELGEIYLKQGKLLKAAKQYSLAARLGPPGTAIAHYLSGYCYETLGDLDEALKSYLMALEIDPYGLSSLESVINISQKLSKHSINIWAKETLNKYKNNSKKNQLV